jgi:hypothetical protein
MPAIVNTMERYGKYFLDGNYYRWYFPHHFQVSATFRHLFGGVATGISKPYISILVITSYYDDCNCDDSLTNT